VTVNATEIATSEPNSPLLVSVRLSDGDERYARTGTQPRHERRPVNITYDRSPTAMRALGRLPKRSYDWDRLRERYVQGEIVDGVRVWPSCEVIAQAENMVPERVRQACARGHWVAQREQFRCDLASALRRRAQEQAQNQVIDVDVEAVDSARRGINLVRARITQIERDLDSQAAAKAAFEEMVASGEKAEAASERTGHDRLQASAVDAREIQDLAAAVAALHATAHKAVGNMGTTRVEFSGRGGGAIEVDQSIRAELTRDDPQRLFALMQAAARAQFGKVEALETGDVMDADVVEG
jgi:hypothetical protein